MGKAHGGQWKRYVSK